MIKNILLITGNANKAKEFRQLLALENLKYHSYPLPEIQSLSIQEVGKCKTEAAFQYPEIVNHYDAILTDDTGLAFSALGGLPGPFVKFFLESLKLEEILDLLQGKSKEATAQCVLSLGLTKTKEVVQFMGEVKGEIVSPTGEEGFGWDGIFLPQGSNLTYAGMDMETKNQISHRALASKKLKEWLQVKEI